MKYEPKLKPDFFDLCFDIKAHSSINEVIERTNDHAQQLFIRFLNSSNGKILSPSAINTWLGCRMKFFYRYVNNITEPERFSADIDPATFGNLLHDIMNNLYLPLKGSLITSGSINNLINDRNKLAGFIDKVFCEKFNKSDNGMIDGNELIVRDVLMTYLVRILNADKTYTPFTIVNIEDPFSFSVSVEVNGVVMAVRAGGKIDRVDVKDGITRIVDYKTGTVTDSISSIASLFGEDRKKDPDGWLQTLLYCEAYLSLNKGITVFPSIYNVKKSSGERLSGRLKIRKDSKTEITVDNFDLVREEFMDYLQTLIKKIFSNDEPFFMTEDIWNKCRYCPYHMLCLR